MLRLRAGRLVFVDATSHVKVVCASNKEGAQMSSTSVQLNARPGPPGSKFSFENILKSGK